MKRTRLKRGGRLSPTSKDRLADLGRRKEIREAVFIRDGGCLLNPWRARGLRADWGECRGELTPHHLVKASQGGAYCEDNLLTLCEFHNGAIEDHPAKAHAAGLVIRSWEAKP